MRIITFNNFKQFFFLIWREVLDFRNERDTWVSEQKIRKSIVFLSLSIQHISTYFPATTLDNQQLSGQFNILPEEIFKKTGINRRFVSAPGEIASDLAFKAAEVVFDQILMPIGQHAVIQR